MASVLPSYILPLMVVSLGFLEMFIFSYFNYFYAKGLKFFKTNSDILSLNIVTADIFKFVLVSHLFSYFTFKTPVFYDFLIFFNIYTLLSFVLFIFFFNMFFFKNQYQLLVIFLLVILLHFFNITSNYIVLLLTLETITTVYFFFFLKNSHDNSYTLLRYKNLISQYLWLSLFTLIFFVINLLLWVYLFGTLDFFELAFFLKKPQYCVPLLISFFWKLGVPTFHFFKLELYQFLDFTSLVLFSIVSLTVNLLLFIYILYILNINFSLSLSPVLYSLIVSIFFLLQGLDKVSFFYFFAISGINTWIFFLIISLS